MTLKFLGSAWTVFSLLHVVSGSNHQCEYQGKTYAEGEDLPTHRLCLSCKCTPDFVEPNDQVCTVIDCPVTDAGCIPIYNDTECCPVSYKCVEKSEAFAKCDERYFRHYAVKGCSPVFGKDNECPERFNCPKDVKVDYAGCQFRDRLYRIGESINTGNPCQICSCQRGWEGIEIICTFVECPNDLLPRLSSCRKIYEPEKCCAVRTECDAEENKEKPEKTCEYGNKTYHLGERFFPEEDPCFMCICTEDWTGISEKSCKELYCTLENKRKKLSQGCLPIYHKTTCCPIDLYCGPPGNISLNRTGPLPSAQDIESGNFCEFKGNRYKIGDVLDTKYRTHCVSCTCLTPPDFTCVHQTCPPPPNDDYENCKPIYTPGECCPSYDCQPEGKCPFIVCGSFCRKVLGADGCWICVCNGFCIPPKCDIGCHLEYDRSAGPCPYCVCPVPDLPDFQCPLPNCLSNCVINYLTKPCPTCSCPGSGSVLCFSPKCEIGCTLDPDAKPCPSCKCENRPAKQCSPVKCESHCQMVQEYDDCPHCWCPECMVPKCGPGCVLLADYKPCPICMCDRFTSRGSTQLSDPLCSQLKCGPGCRRADNTSSPSERCPMCICRGRSGEHLTCAAKQCELPCELERFSEHGCPSCSCNSSSCMELDCPPEQSLVMFPWDRCPHCVPEDNSDGPRLLDDGCPDDSLCQKSCKNRKYKSGKCNGNTCICR